MALILIILVLIVAIVYPIFDEGTGGSAELLLTRGNLFELCVTTYEYHRKTGAYPSLANWRSELDPYRVWREVPLHELAVDGWGNEIQYKWNESEESTPAFYSYGLNKRDDGGREDDIVYRVSD